MFKDNKKKIKKIDKILVDANTYERLQKKNYLVQGKTKKNTKTYRVYYFKIIINN